MQNQSSFQVYNASAGSGKTFTLVKEYIKILLSSNNAFKFQQILAITFTNKAAGEMKERVIQNLHTFSKKQRNDMLTLFCSELNLSEEIIFSRSEIILKAILRNYSAFNITTIDSFTHKIIRTFAHDLNLPLNSEVELDAESLLNEAVDIVISKIGENQELTNVLLNYTLQKLDQDKSWDISQDLKKFAKLILNENHLNQLKLLSEVSIDAFKSLKDELYKQQLQIEKEFKIIGEQGCEIIKNSSVEIGEFSHGGELPKHFIKLTQLKHLKIEDLKFNGRLNNTIEQDKSLAATKCDSNTKKTIEEISTDLKALYYKSKKAFEEFYATYLLNGLIIESIIPLGVLNYINTALQDIKKEQNILLNSEFNQLIRDTIKGEPAPFIYERLGEKFRYYFIDEMQDTSVLQWQNLIPLIDHALSSENDKGETGKLLLVGDAKQSIYRWRGGKASQFIQLSSIDGNSNPFSVAKNTQQLDTNYRSFPEIINFNNNFFTHIVKFLSDQSHKRLYAEGNSQKVTTKKGGFVQVSFVDSKKEKLEKELVYPKKVLEIIQNLDLKFLRNELCVLVRTRNQGVSVANYLMENNIEIISSETLILKKNEKVNFIIHLLHLILSPSNKEIKAQVLYFLHEYLEIKDSKHSFLNAFIELSNSQFFDNLQKYHINFSQHEFIQNPFYESVEYIVRSFNLAKESDSYIQFFLDVIFEFSQKKQGTIQEFLEFWELKKDRLSIVAPEAKNAVRIMTIHKAKGLEFPVVIFPYSMDIYKQIDAKTWYPYHKNPSFKSLLINYNKKLTYLGEQGETIYNSKRSELELDTFNLLYVALTRAVEQLYIITEDNKSKSNMENTNHTSGLFISYLKENGLLDTHKKDYYFGDSKRIVAHAIEKSNTTTQNVFISNAWKNHKISIVANSSLLWNTDQGDAINYGNLLHEILSKIKTKNDILEVVNQYLFKGVISKETSEELIEILTNMVDHPRLSPYFEHNCVVFNEREILTVEKNILIPDRLIFSNNQVTILDYKTGKFDQKHVKQIHSYAKALTDLNFLIGKKLLIYINDEISIEEV